MISPGRTEQTDSKNLTEPPRLSATLGQNAAIMGAEILLLETEEEAIYLPLILKQ
jgi:hypothetical protein